MEMSWLQSINDFKYLLFLLVPVGIYLMVISIKKITAFAKAKMIYEMPVSSIDGSFTIEESGKYDIWLCGKKYSVSPIYNLDIKLKNNATGKSVILYPDFFRTTANSFKDARIKLYTFSVESGSYNISLTDSVEERENIIRPLLALSKKEILDYIEKESLDYVTDSTNLEDIYTRNYIRHKVIPCMEKLNVCSQKHISAAGDEIYEAYKYIKDIAKEKLEKISVYRYEGKITAKERLKSSDKNFSIGIEKEVFDKEPDIIKNYMIYTAFEGMVKGLKDVSNINIKDITALTKKTTGKQIHLPHNIIAYTDYTYLWLENKLIQKKAVKRLDSKPLEIDNLCSIEIFNCDKNFTPPNLKYTKYFDADKLKSDIKLRYRQAGDYISIKSGKKSLKSFMTDEKIPAAKRDEVKLIACDSHVLWVIGYRISEYYKIKIQEIY